MPLSALVPVQSGGTGATNPADAQANLNLFSLTKLASALLSIGMNQQSFGLTEKSESALASQVIDSGAFSDTSFDAAPISSSRPAFDGRYIYGGVADSSGGLDPSVPLVLQTFDTYGNTISDTLIPSSIRQNFVITPTVGGSDAALFSGYGAFDGRYAYLSGMVLAISEAGSASIVNLLQKDINGNLEDAAAYSVFNLMTLLNSIGITIADILAASYFSILDCTYDGKYVYYVGVFDDGITQKEFIIRFDTQGDFETATDWAIFDISTIVGYVYTGAGYNIYFAGQYLYVTTFDTFYRYDLTADFTLAASWAVATFAALGLSITGRLIINFDGSYLYFADSTSFIARLGVAADFSVGANYTELDLSTLDANYVRGASGAFYDGKYLWVIPRAAILPFLPGTTASVLKYDTAGTFTDAGAWELVTNSKFLTPSASGRVFSTTYDGKNVYTHYTDQIAVTNNIFVTEIPQRTIFPGTGGAAIGALITAIESLAANGLIAKTSATTAEARSIVQPAAGITVADGDGVAGNPTLALANDLAALEALATTGLAVRTALDTWAQRTLTGTANQLTVTNGDGVAGNPTLSLPAALVLPGSIDPRAGGIVGKTDGVAVAAGDIGEVLSSSVASGEAIALTTTVAANITTLVLTPGVWEVEGNVNFGSDAATVSTVQIGAINTISATLPNAQYQAFFVYATGFTGLSTGLKCPSRQFNVSVNTTVYLVARGTFTTNTLAAYGTLSAIRIG